jgi:hypothetical protein
MGEDLGKEWGKDLGEGRQECHPSLGGDAVRAALEPVLRRQVLHPVWGRLAVDWEAPHSVERLTVVVRGQRLVMSLGELDAALKRRESMIADSRRDPLRYLCEPEEYRRIDLEVVRKRLAMPGVQLMLWVSGGIRSAKTEFVTRRIAAHYWWTERAWCWGFHQTDTTSRSIQQARVARFLPPEMNPESGKLKKNRTTKFSYSEGTGFTGSEFNVYWDASDWRGEKKRMGGRFEFRFYGQDPGTMVGQELTCATCDELVPPGVVKLIDDRLLTRAAETREPAFMEAMQEAEKILERGEALPLPLLAKVYQGWNLISFTPKEGWTPSTAMFLQGARMYDFYDPRPMVQEAMEQVIASMPTPEARDKKRAELAENPWRLGSVDHLPRFAQPVDERKLVAFLPTYANKFAGNWPGAVQSMQGKSDEQIKITLFGIVSRNVQSLLGFDSGRHVRKESELPVEGTIYEVADPAPKKPWVLKWYLVDVLGRIWVVQEWPCQDWEIPEVGFPGAWAVPTEGDKLNGDKGPAQRLALPRDWTDYTRRMWMGRKRLAERLRKVHGDTLRVRTERVKMEWSDRPGEVIEGEVVEVARTLMDSRFAAAPTVSRGGEGSTPLEEMLETEHALDWEPASGAKEHDGIMLMQARMSSDVVGMPGMVCVEECRNTVFAWNTYTLPEDAEHARKNDEACKDFIDPDRYLVLMDPWHEPDEVMEEAKQSRRARAEARVGGAW